MEVPVKLDIFEGPLDLLLHLIRKNEVDIYDIPISLITKQYLEYIDLMQELNIDLAGEFLVMASTLTHIKSRTLLPSHDPNQSDEEGDDPRLDLVEQLKEHMRFKEAADRLESRPWLDRDVFVRGGAKEDVAQAQAAPGEEYIAAGLFDLIEAFRGLLSTRGTELSFSLPEAGITIEERMTQILNLVRDGSAVSFAQCFSRDHSRTELVVTFLAILELMRLGLIRAYQQRLEDLEQGVARWSPLRLYSHDPEAEEEAQP